MGLFEKADKGITNLLDGDKDGAVLDDVFKFASGGAFKVVGEGVKEASPVGKVLGPLLGAVGDPAAAAGEDYVGLLRNPLQALRRHHRRGLQEGVPGAGAER